MTNAERFQDVDTTVNGIPLGNATQIQPHPLIKESDGIGTGVQHHRSVIHLCQAFRQLFIGGLLSGAKVVQVADGTKADVEGAMAQFRNPQRLLKHRKETVAHLHRSVGRLAVNPGQFGIFPVTAHLTVDTVEQSQHGISCLAGHGRILGPELHLYGGGHCRTAHTYPFGLGRHGHSQQRGHTPRQRPCNCPLI